MPLHQYSSLSTIPPSHHQSINHPSNQSIHHEYFSGGSSGNKPRMGKAGVEVVSLYASLGPSSAPLSSSFFGGVEPRRKER
mmetsp:Transcript_7536/g.15335  ORF Transcript_7536/g.15335 Transcript_7536/m.15335 type:complete len:81 (-) Transcript_7536:218-460(-)